MYSWKGFGEVPRSLTELKVVLELNVGLNIFGFFVYEARQWF